MYTDLNIPRPDDDKQAIEGIPALYPSFSDLLKTLKEQKSDYLIIDLRHNSGGMPPLCRPLLYMPFGDNYLNYDCKAEYNRRLSKLQLKKWRLDSIEEYNKGNNTSYLTGDIMFGYFSGSRNTSSIEEKRKDLSFISYYNSGIGSEYTKELNGKAYIVGTPSRQAGNTCMETTNFELPNTKITGSISNAFQLFYPDDPDKGKVLMPDFAMSRNDFAKYNFDSNAEIMFVLDLINNNKIK
jgi:hypothetical protein